MLNIPGYRINEQLYNGSRTLVYRAVRETDSLPVVIKLLKNPYPSFSELVQFRNQYTIAKNLNSSLIVQTYSLEPYQNGYALVMEDFGGISLKQYFASLEPRNFAFGGEFLQIAIALCNTLDILYCEQIIHKDIKPSNILINPETKQVKLIDFSIASLLPRENQTIINPNVLEGTLSYISPEQTGRMNRGIDYRTDFYSLGVTFYELLTGELPFQSTDPIEMVHCHIAKIAPLVHEINPNIPSVISDIVSKLMAKNAEYRYQSTLGLKFDLENCWHQLKETGTIDSFPIAQQDVCVGLASHRHRFIISDKLYGRETEINTLLEAFTRVSLGATEIILVAGFSGIGKTAIVNELHKPIVGKRGYFIKGKYDQFQRNVPFSGFVQAFRDLMGQLLTESDTQIQQWKRNILSAVGENGQVIIEVIPELERIIGKQPSAPELSGSAAQNRFHLLFQKFTQVFTTPEHPLVMFLDDLQWADSASLKLIELLMVDTSHLLIVGAYRDNEVTPAHQLMLTLSEIEKTSAKIQTITLVPLTQLQVNQLIADTLKCSENIVLPLSQLVFQKTQGNPFFATQFLKALHQDKCIQFIPSYPGGAKGGWQCDIAQVSQQAVTDDVVDFMTFQLKRLPQSTQHILQLAACIGNQFDLATLAIVSQHSEIEAAGCLWKALQEGLVLPTCNVYKFYLVQENLGVTPEIQETVTYKFLHDRVQQAAYSLIPEDQRQVTHLQIGQLLFQNTPASQQEERIFEIVSQLNAGLALISKPAERQQLAELNLKAGCRAKISTAYNVALEYLNLGIQLLTIDSWKTTYDLTRSLHEELAEIAFSLGDFAQMEASINIVLQNTHTLIDRIRVYELKLQANRINGQSTQAIALGRQILQELGVYLPEFVTQEEIYQKVTSTLAALDNRTIEDLVHLPKTKDPQVLIALRIMASLVPCVYSTAPYLFPIIACEALNLFLKHGNSILSAPGYADFGIIVSSVLNKPKVSYQFGQLALKMLDIFQVKAVRSMTEFKVAAFTQFNQQHIRDSITLLQEAYIHGLEIGDFMHMSISAIYRLVYLYFSGIETLENILKTIEIYQDSTSKNNFLSRYYKIIGQAIKNLTQFTQHPDYLVGELCDEEKLLPILLEEQDIFILHVLFLCKSILAYLFGDFAQAWNYAIQGEQYLQGGAGMATVPLFHYYYALALLAVYPQAEPSQQKTLLSKVQEHQAQLQLRAQFAPVNFQHLFDLVEAEYHRVLNNKAEAIEYYDRAISKAKANGYIQQEALSNEICAKFYLKWDKEKLAQAYMQQAYYCYARWGAKAKINELEKRYPQLLQAILQQQRINLNPQETIALHGTFSSTCTNTTDSTSISNLLDFTSVLKAAQAISSSLKLDQLIANLTGIIMENSGAKKSALILPQEDDIAVRGFSPLKEVSVETWQVRAITSINHQEIQTILEPQSLDTCQDIPVNIINYVKNTQQTIVIDNCQTNISGIIGEYMQRIQPLSVLCTPIINQGHLMGILYLENQLTQGVFSSDRLSVINLLCTQAAISLENAQLYTNLQGSEARFHRLAENAPGMIYQFQLSPEGIARLSYVSTGCYEIYEIPSEQAVADANSLISQTHPDDVADYLESINISAQTLEPWRYEGRIITPSGQLKWIQAASRPIKQADGTIIWDGLLLDVTERKQAEAAVIQKSQELKTAIQDLQQAQLQIVQNEKMSALGNLVAGVAHEMNNPLGFIAASLQQTQPTLADIIQHLKLYQESFPHQSEEIKDHAQEIDLNYVLEDLPQVINAMLIACARLKNISTSLRTFSRADKDYKVPFNLHEGIDSTILILKHRLKANDQRPAIEVVTKYGNLPKIECFPGQLNQVFMNILANAIDALEEANQGRSFEEIKLNSNRITITTSVEDQKVKVMISDNGQGISEEIQHKIFDHLFTTKGVGKGTGLGLAIARQIVVEKHGGTIAVESTINEGTTFVISLPK
nr:AAA family ATPase [Nostoc sp. CreGUA01]